MLKTSTQRETGATASVPRDMGEEKDEPDFIETHCHWVGCDREMGCNDELVKVIKTTTFSSSFSSLESDQIRLDTDCVVLSRTG